MNFLLIIALLCLGPLAAHCNSPPKGNLTAMERAKIVPDLIDRLPKMLTYAVYSYPTASVYMDLGEGIITPTQARDPPNNLYWLVQNKLYTFVLVDADYPSPQNRTQAEFLHWLVINVPITDLHIDANKGDTYAEYVGPIPGKGTGLHRYVLLIYEQIDRITALNRPKISKHTKEGRLGFKVRQFAKDNKLTNYSAAAGSNTTDFNPDSGNFFLSQWDDLVPKIEEQLAGK